MRAPVYRSIDARQTLLGLAFPSEVLILLVIVWAAMPLLKPGQTLLVVAGAYGGIRLLGYGRAPLFLQHWLNFQLRRGISGGRLSAAARSPQPRFPFAHYEARDARRLGGSR